MVMTDFNTYWKEKAQKRRKAWAAKAKRFAEQHTQLESIRKDVFLPLDYAANSSLDDYKVSHYTKCNPIALWKQGRLEFSESGLRQAMEAEGAGMSSFKMEVNKQRIVGKEAPQPKVTDYSQYASPTKVYEIEDDYRAWLKRMYEICTELETCKLTYGPVSMVIRRYSTDGLPFGYYELIPCEQLVKSAMLMEETSFNRLNVATLLMEMAAEYELRQEELNYHAKKLKIRKMEAVTTEGIAFELWDDKKLEKKVGEYIGKGYSLDKILAQVLRPWKTAVQKYIEAISERDNQNGEFFNPYCRLMPSYIAQVLRPYFDGAGLREVKIWLPNERSSEICFEYKGFEAKHYSFDGLFYPNAHYDWCCLPTPGTLSALAGYLKIMPELSSKTDEVVAKVTRLYDQMIQQKEA